MVTSIAAHQHREAARECHDGVPLQLFEFLMVAVDNLSSVPTIVICFVLAFTKNRRVHGFLAPMVLVVVFVDILLINRILGSG